MKNIFYFKNKDVYKNLFMQQKINLKKVHTGKTIAGSLIALFLLISTGCTPDDFLDKTQLNSLAADSFWQTEKDANMGVMGCYDALQGKWIYNTEHVNFAGLSWDGLADNAQHRWTWQQWEGYSRNNVSPATWFFEMVWSSHYKGIGRFNEAIFRIGEMTEEQISAAAKKRFIAEVRFIRALYYSNMVATFNDVPLVIEVQASTDEPAKSDRKTIVEFIESELLAIVGDLPPTIDAGEWGRASKGAAYTLLARTNLFNIDNGGTYEKAAQYAGEVLNLGYTLFDDYEKLFKDYNEINNEVIFPVVFVRGPEDNGSSFEGTWGNGVNNYVIYPMTNLADDYYCTDGKPIQDPVSGAMNPLYNPDNVWENRDPRLTGTIVGEGATWRDMTITAGDMSAEPTGLAFRKWREEEDHTENRFDSPQDWYVFRLGHVLLMRAEALIMSGQHTHGDVNASINELRARVGMPSVEDAEGTGLSNQDYIDLIRHEWRVETAMEGWRFHNVQRWGQLEETYNKVNETDHLLFPSVIQKKVYDPRLEVFPIPLPELDRNTNLVQNPVWQ
tara:strand:+ start:1969 stop:3642 length:1674 start_codon:yes stop_codon:yes gene_type:complete